MPRTCEGCKDYKETSLGWQCHRYDFTFPANKKHTPLYQNCHSPIRESKSKAKEE